MNAEESFERDALRADIAADRADQPYINAGYSGRDAYLRGLAEDYGLELDTVLAIANVLGPNEDFDGLVTALEDYTEEF